MTGVQTCALPIFRANQDGREYYLWYKKNSTSTKWTKTDEKSGADVYLFYKKSRYTRKITIHHTDLGGLAIPGVSDTVVDAAEWGSNAVVFTTYAKTIPGYTFSANSVNATSNRGDTYDPNNQIWISTTNDATGSSKTRGVSGVS